ncbi:MAG: TrkH family potassium uptake protein [Chitinivibrionales bacterium]|nr:TrkH family potassium uptake protein [Chitinivibrionales bacterium]
MNHRLVIFALGRLLQMLAGAMVVPTVIGYAEVWPAGPVAALGDPRVSGFFLAITLSLVVGTMMTRAQRAHEGFASNAVREGFAIVAFGWVLLTLFGALPLFVYFLYVRPADSAGSVLHCFTDAFFEVMSGFTTTGATILTDIEQVPHGQLFWRSMTHWLGGMGIVTLVLAIFPAFGIAGYQMFRGEVPGPTAERLRPRLAQTAKILWWVYALLTFAEALLLYLGGMTVFDSFCHAFGTMATGGFSTRNASIGAYESAYIDWVVVVFMLLAGTNFMIHYSVLFTGRLGVLKHDREFRFYLSVITIAVLIGTGVVWVRGVVSPETALRSFRPYPKSEAEMSAHLEEEQQKVETLPGAFRQAAFQVVSLTTTTGYATADFDVWPGALRLMFVVLMFFGGCAGSTGGGMKMIRVLVVLKAAIRQVRQQIQPRSVVPVKVGGRALPEGQVSGILGFFVMFVLLFVLLTLIMSFIIPDFSTAVTAVVATICNIGPGLSGIGAVENYAWIPLGGKWILSLSMLLGRLEVYTVLIAISPISWRK